MDNQDRERFAMCMAAMAEAFSQVVSDIKGDIYYKALSDIPIEAIERAVWSIINTRTTATFPKVAEIREAVSGKVEDSAMLALSKVEKAVREVGGYSSVVFDDPVIHAVVSTFNNGWVGICDMSCEEWKWSRKDFLKLYEAMSRNGRGNIEPVLHGRHYIQNDNAGYKKAEEIEYVGDKVKAIAWQREIEQGKERETPMLTGRLYD